MGTLFEKGKINENYDISKIKKTISDDAVNKIYNLINEKDKIVNTDSYLEISYRNTFAFKNLLEKFNKGAFVSDDSFESLLVYHFTQIEKKQIDIYHKFFIPKNISNLKFNEKFDFILSLCGLTFENLYSLIPTIVSFLKVEGKLAVLIPTCWFNRENMNKIEQKIIGYAKKNDKKWVFTEDLEPAIKEYGGESLGIIDTDIKLTFSRFEIAKLFSLTKLYDAVIKNNMAQLELADLPEYGIEINTSILIIKKKKKTITKDNLFNI